ncbi:MAG: SusD/RagB family nutrient-binding outer membrane lipoprotein [Bacteroidales bacterium]|nr:SusD/RagB family nutrient-binding outer membrane lipoprotein [Bacteroidales bacterium]
MKRIKILTIIASFLMLFVVSCDKGFEDINKDPNNPTEIESGLLLADMIRNSQNTLYSTFVGGDYGSCWSQQWGKVNYNDEEKYKPRGSIISMIWDNMYEDVASDASVMYKLAVVEENKNMQGVALVMKAFAILVLTDIYGDIPYTEALNTDEGILAPAYDEQSVVYDSVLVLLDRANDLFSEDGGVINAGSDLIYQGDWTAWQKFANSLKFRALMRMSGQVDVSTQLQDIVDNRAVFTSNSDEAKLIFLSSDPNANPIYESIVFGTREEYKVTDILVATLADNDDPRLEVYVQPNADGEYRGKPAGMNNLPNEEYNYENVSAIGELYLLPEAPGYMMSYSELQFLMAEAVVKGYITGTAQDYYAEGIAASMSANGVTDYSMMSGLLLSANTNNALEQIGVQNWLGLYCQGMEAWAEQRRTGYPVLTPAIDGAVDEIPSRLIYPASEQSLNAANYQEAVSRQGADLLTTKIWWNK